MPSIAWQNWENVQKGCLAEIDRQCDSCSPSAAPNPVLLDENLRGYIMLLSAHLQAFCRDLYAECAQVIVDAAPGRLKLAIQTQFTAKMEIDKANPRRETLRGDFDRFGLDLNVMLDANPANAAPLTDLGLLNSWRNFVAHRGVIPPKAGSLSLVNVRSWKNSCDLLVTELDSIMYNFLRAMLGYNPW